MEMLKKFRIQKNILAINAAVPFVALSIDFLCGRLGANPPEAFIRTTGIMAILFLTLSLCVTPMVRGLKIKWLLPHRRVLGLCAFYYATAHLISYIFFDKSGVVKDVIEDIVKRPFILVGFLSFLLMIPLAATSTATAMRKLGIKKWNKLHMATYAIAVGAVVHFAMIVKSDYFYPGLFGVLIVVLFAWRIRRKLSN